MQNKYYDEIDSNNSKQTYLKVIAMNVNSHVYFISARITVSMCARKYSHSGSVVHIVVKPEAMQFAYLYFIRVEKL